MIEFWKGLIVGGDSNVSMAKTLTWLTFILIIISWFVLPERSITELVALFVSLLTYTWGGKNSWLKYNKVEPEAEKK